MKLIDPENSLAIQNVYELKRYRIERNIDPRDQFLNRSGILIEEYNELEDANNTDEALDAYADMVVVCLNAIDGIDGFDKSKSEDFMYDVLSDDKSHNYKDTNTLIGVMVKLYCSYDLMDLIKTEKDVFNKNANYATIASLIIKLCMDGIRELGYNPNGVLNEAIKHILSREQDPEQKKEWENGERKGKWLKNKNQSRDSVYYPNYKQHRL